MVSHQQEEGNIVIAYQDLEELDRIKKYYTIKEHFKHIKLVIVNATEGQGQEQEDKAKETAKELTECKVARCKTIYTVGYERVYDFGLDARNIAHTLSNTFIPQITYRDIHRLIRFDFAIDEITRLANSPVPPCGDSNAIIILDTGIYRAHESFSRDYVVHLSDTHVLRAEGLVEQRSVVDDTGEDDFRVHGHGTAVAFLTRSFAPNADIFSIKVIKKVGDNEWIATDEELLRGLDLALHIIDDERQRKHSFGVPYLAEIFNMSLGGAPTPTPTPVELAIENISKTRKQAIFIAAAGNTGPYQGSIVTPAQSPWCVAVGACTTDFIATQFSARGPTRGIVKPEYLMQGVDIVAASRTGSSSYASFTGTSFATPLLSGGIATTVSGAIFITPQVQSFIRQVQDLRLDIQGIMNYVGTRITVKPTIDPSANLRGKDNTYGWGIPMGDLVAQQLNFAISSTRTMQQLPLTSIVGAVMLAGFFSIMANKMVNERVT